MHKQQRKEVIIAMGVKYRMAVVDRRISQCVYMCVPNITEDLLETEVGKGNHTAITVIVHTKINLNGI